MRYVLMTGVTGLLGRYLAKDLLTAGIPLAVVARSSRRASARDRVEGALCFWEEHLGCKLPRPVVLEGDISEPDLGLDARGTRWVAEHCDTVLHNAASLTFLSTGRDAEPWRSNVDGTQNVLDLCKNAKIGQFHHVSTAYVAGLRTGTCYEHELDVGQDFSNDYERSKVEAENLVRNAKFLNKLTIFRPAIIIGDSQTGFSTTFHGFYAPLQALHMMMTHREPDPLGWTAASARFSLDGHETKNLVPVEWVSAVMSAIITQPRLHGQTYHLTPRHPVTARLMGDIFEETLRFYPVRFAGRGVSFPNPTEHEELFQQMITVYRSYWKDDPTFDATNTSNAVPHLPCPHIDRKTLRMMANWAIQARFESPNKARGVEPEFDAHTVLDPLVEAAGNTTGGDSLISLQVRGHGGGQWHVTMAGKHLIAADQGLDPEACATVDLDIDTLAEIARGELSVDSACSSGKVHVLTGQLSRTQLSTLLQKLTGTRVPSLLPR